MKDNRLHKVGNYGSEETCQDEINSVECAQEIYHFLVNNYPINGYVYKILEKGIPEYLPYKRDGYDYPVDAETHYVQPDIPAIILQEVTKPDNFYIVLSGDDKYQGTAGNAIERSNKNHRAVFEEKLCKNSDIVPYVLFLSGEAFIDENGKFSAYFTSKLRQMMPYEAGYWEFSKPHSSFKRKWNLVYVQNERFSKESKLTILKKVAIQAATYYKTLLNEL